MNNNQLTFSLIKKTDRKGDVYFIGSGDAPIFIDVQNTTLLFFPPSDDAPYGKLLIRNRDFVNRKAERDSDRDDD